jgi:hypothetical protein
MPTATGYQCGFWEADPRRWERCRRDAATGMLAEGWNPRARKFDEVMIRRARRLWRTA